MSHDNIKQTNQQDHPDKDISNDPTRQIVAVHGDSSVPEERRQSPGIGSGYGGEVDEGGQAAVTPVSNGLVDEVCDEDDLGAPEVVSGPEENPGKDE